MRKTWQQLKKETMTAAERKKASDLQEMAFAALKVAVRKAIQQKKRLGLPIYVMRNGKVVNINPKKRRAKADSNPKTHPQKPRAGHRAMKPKKARKKPVALHDKAFTALKVAVRKAIRERMRAGLPVYVERGRKIVNLNPQRRPKAKSRRAA